MQLYNPKPSAKCSGPQISAWFRVKLLMWGLGFGVAVEGHRVKDRRFQVQVNQRTFMIQYFHFMPDPERPEPSLITSGSFGFFKRTVGFRVSGLGFGGRVESPGFGCWRHSQARVGRSFPNNPFFFFTIALTQSFWTLVKLL